MAPPVGILGDADGDGEVSIIDATTIQRYLLNIKVNSFVFAAADTDQDDELSIIDATFIQRYLLGVPCPDDIGKPIKSN